MGGNEGKALVSLRREQGGERLIRIIATIAIDEGLGDDKAAGEGDIELFGIGLAAKLDGCLLKVAIAEFIEEVHKHRGDAIEESAGKVGEAREVDPPELLDGREACGELVRVDPAAAVGKGNAVIERIETITSWLPIFDGEADEVFGGGAGFPVHGE